MSLIPHLSDESAAPKVADIFGKARAGLGKVQLQGWQCTFAKRRKCRVTL